MQQAMSYLQGMSNPFEGVLEAYDSGLQARRYRNETQAQQVEQARKEQAQLSLETVDWNNQQEISQLIAQFPEYTKGAQDYYNNMEAKEQKAYLATSSKYMSAIDSGRVDIAVNDARDRAAAYRDMGNEEKAQEYSDLAEWMAKDHVSARKGIALGYAANAPTSAGSNYEAITKADIAQNESPYTIKEKVANAGATDATAFKTRADAQGAINEGLSTAAIGGDAAGFSLKAGMMHAQGLINDAQKQYIDERLADEDTEAVATFLDGLAGQNVEIAKLNKPETSVLNAGGKLVAIRTNADGSVEIVGSVDKTLSPDVAYTTDASTENSIRSTNAQIDIATQRDATARDTAKYEADVKKWIADRDAEVKAGLAKPTVINGIRYLVYPNGKHQMMVNQKGEPFRDDGTGGKPPNESQANSLMYGTRMQSAHNDLVKLEKAGVTRGSLLAESGSKGGVLATIAPSFLGGNSQEQRQYLQAKRNFINAVLRKESGAVISPSEFANAERQYFPQVGDNAAVIKQKQENRDQVTKTMLSNSGQVNTPTKKGADTINKETKTFK